MKRAIIFLLIAVAVIQGFGQKRPAAPPAQGNAAAPAGPLPRPSGPKPYKDVITDKAVTHRGLITVHKVEDKWYFEIADSILNREILAVTRYTRTPAGGNNYGGERVNEQTI